MSRQTDRRERRKDWEITCRPTKLQQEIARIRARFGYVDFRNFSRHPKGQPRTRAPEYS